MIDWQQIDTVLVDMDGTLLDLHYDNYFWMTHLPKRYAEIHGVDEHEASTHLHQQIKSIEGSLQWYCLDHWSEKTQTDITALKREILHKIQIRPHVEEFLDALKKRGKKIVLITNSHPNGLELKMEVTQLDRWLDLIVSSHQFQSPKEDQRFWHQLQKLDAFDPQRTLFIDDTPRILRSAHHYGIAHLVCIVQPDSQKAPTPSNEFFDIHHFDEIMPA